MTEREELAHRLIKCFFEELRCRHFVCQDVEMCELIKEYECMTGEDLFDG
jgi:hypothetical protein